MNVENNSDPNKKRKYPCYCDCCISNPIYLADSKQAYNHREKMKKIAQLDEQDKNNTFTTIKADNILETYQSTLRMGASEEKIFKNMINNKELNTNPSEYFEVYSRYYNHLFLFYH